jgi:hypothetical protein
MCSLSTPTQNQRHSTELWQKSPIENGVQVAVIQIKIGLPGSNPGLFFEILESGM